MWLVYYDEYGRRQKHYEKKRPKELAAVLDNLDTFLMALNQGVPLAQARNLGFVHPEPHGVLAIDQKGGGAKLAQTRLYIYPDEKTQILHIITLGDKKQQPGDITTSSHFVIELRKKEAEST